MNLSSGKTFTKEFCMWEYLTLFCVSSAGLQKYNFLHGKILYLGDALLLESFTQFPFVPFGLKLQISFVKFIKNV